LPPGRQLVGADPQRPGGQREVQPHHAVADHVARAGLRRVLAEAVFGHVALGAGAAGEQPVEAVGQGGVVGRVHGDGLLAGAVGVPDRGAVDPRPAAVVADRADHQATGYGRARPLPDHHLVDLPPAVEAHVVAVVETDPYVRLPGRL